MSNDTTPNYNLIVDKILNSDIKTDDKIKINNDFMIKDLDMLNKRSVAYQSFLEYSVADFHEKNIHQQELKKTFLVWTMVLLSVVVAATLTGVLIIVFKKTISFSDLAAAISAIVGLITAFILLPRLIAQNLFPANEDDDTKTLFVQMFQSDMKIREHYSKQSDETTNYTDDQKQ